MVDMSKFSMAELRADLAETEEDIALCDLALKIGIREYSGGRVQERLDTNLKIEALIETELERRDDSD